MMRPLLICVCASVAATAAAGEMRVLYDTGETTPISELFGDPALREMSLAPPRELRPPPDPPEDLVFPVRSLRLKAGRAGVAPAATKGLVRQRPGMRPIFFVGDDPISAAWLRGNAGYLKETGAVGLVVAVESRARFEALARQAPGLALFPGSGDDIARQLGLTHYPVLITNDGARQ